MSEYEIHLDPKSNDLTQELTVKDGDNDIATLLYGPINGNPDEYAIDFIGSYTKKHGAALALIKDMVRRIGEGKTVMGTIANEETRKFLENGNLVQQALQTGSITVSDPDTLSAIPFFRFIRMGGIQPQELLIQKQEDKSLDYTYTLKLIGITDPEGKLKPSPQKTAPTS